LKEAGQQNHRRPARARLLRAAMTNGEESRNGMEGRIFRLVRRPGLKCCHPLHENEQGGQTRVYSKALVEKNKKKRRPVLPA